MNAAADWQPPVLLYLAILLGAAFAALTVMARRHARGAPVESGFQLALRWSARIGYALLLWALGWMAWEAVEGYAPGVLAFHWPLATALLLILGPAALASERRFRAKRRCRLDDAAYDALRDSYHDHSDYQPAAPLRRQPHR